MSCLAHTEAVIDFGADDREDDVSDAALHALQPRVRTLLAELQRHLHDGRRGELVREGIHIALAGPPNAGTISLHVSYLSQILLFFHLFTLCCISELDFQQIPVLLIQFFLSFPCFS